LQKIKFNSIITWFFRATIVSICDPEQGEILGREINEEDLMKYWDSSEESKDVLAREADEAMKPCIFKSHNLCMFA